MKTRLVHSFSWALALAACSSSPRPDAPKVPVPQGATGDASALAYFEGAVDVQKQTMSITWRSPSGGVLTTESLPYGGSPGDVFFHTCSVSPYGTLGAHVLSGTVQAVNLMSGSVLNMTAVIDATSSVTVTPSGGTAIATYGTVAPNAASNCGAPNAVWQFTDTNDTNFTFSGHASGNAPCTSSASSPVAMYKLDDSPVTNGATIAATLGSNGTFSSTDGSNHAIAGKFGGAVGFNAGNSNSVGPIAGPTLGTGNFSVSAWINPTTNTSGGIASEGGICSIDGWHLDWSHDNVAGALRLEVCNGSSCQDVGTGGGALVIDGNWHHVAVSVTRGGASSTVLYLDGVSVATGLVNAATNLTDTKLYIGQLDPAGCGNWDFTGGIDDVQVFSRAITPAEVTALLSRGTVSAECDVQQACVSSNCQ